MSMKMEAVKCPYEISLWDFIMDDNGDLKERKLAVIGSDTMTAQSRAIDPVFTKNINGTKNLTFKMYTQYFDEVEQKTVDNPFVKLMVVERIVKLYYKDKWYDLVIKKRQESSDKKTYSFTASDLHINELSKNGFNLEFKTELRNNQGTVLDLGEQIVNGTLWSIDRENSDIIRAYVDEQLYSFYFNSDTLCRDMLTDKEILMPAGTYAYMFYSSVQSDEVEKQIIYSDLYHTAANLNDVKMTDDGVILLDEDNTNQLHNCLCYCGRGGVSNLEIASYKGKKLVKKPLTKYNPILDRYVNVFLDNQNNYVEGYTKTEYLSPTFVENYIVNGEDIKSTDGWNLALQEEAEKTSTCDLVTYPKIEDLLKSNTTDVLNLNYKNYLKFHLYNLDSFENVGFISNYKKIGRIQKGDKFSIFFRFKLEEQLGTDDYIKTEIMKFQFYNDSNPELPDKLATFSPIQRVDFKGKKFAKVTATFDYDLSEEDVRHLHFLIFRNPANITAEQYAAYFETVIYLEELQVFKEVYCDKYFTGKTEENFFLNGQISDPEQVATNITKNIEELSDKISGLVNKVKNTLENAGALSGSEEYYYDQNNNLVIKNAQLLPGEVPLSGAVERKFFYSPTENLSARKEEDYVYLDSREELYIQLYNDKDYSNLFGGDSYRRYEKITSIEQAESNRFNLIQGLCEKFQCWADFVIEHDSKGYILNRKIRFKEYIGIRKFSGFKYGINLKSIQRTVDSGQIVTKTIVKPNNNKFAQNGFCTITRAQDNFLKQNYILDFSYYINQGLISEELLRKDLYLDFNGYKKLDGVTSAGYYELMLERGLKRNSLSESLVGLLSNELKVKSNTTVLEEGIAEAKKAYLKGLEDYKTFLKVDYPQMPTIEKRDKETDEAYAERVESFKNTVRKNLTFIDLCTRIENSSNTIIKLEAELASYDQYNAEFFTEERKKINRQIEDLNIEKIQQDFFNKYCLFLLEGTWTSENYYDDNLYYIDALDVSRTSAKPKISYTINVIDVSPLSGFEPYNMNTGDKTYIEDTEFFGWVYTKNGIKTPYKEEVVIIETAEHLDNLNANQIKVQNYKIQFDDLFQRIAASIQSLTYASGGYQKAANAVASGQVDPSYFQNTLEQNSIDIKNGGNQNVYWDELGITVHDGEQQNRFVRLSGDGLKISIDGGQTWRTAVTGEGISTEYLRSGTIDAGVINIITNGSRTFTWDTNGITAFAWEDGQNGIEVGSEFIRLDQYGIYHIKEGNNFIATKVEDINDKSLNGESNFALLRDGSLWLGRFKLTETGLDSSKFTEEELVTEWDTYEFASTLESHTYDENSATECLRLSVFPEEWTEANLDQYDIDKDGKITAFDAREIKRYVNYLKNPGDSHYYSMSLGWKRKRNKDTEDLDAETYNGLFSLNNSIVFTEWGENSETGELEKNSYPCILYYNGLKCKQIDVDVLNIKDEVSTAKRFIIYVPEELRNSTIDNSFGSIYERYNGTIKGNTLYIIGSYYDSISAKNGGIILRGVTSGATDTQDSRIYISPDATYSGDNGLGIRMIRRASSDDNTNNSYCFGDLFGNWCIRKALYFGSEQSGTYITYNNGEAQLVGNWVLQTNEITAQNLFLKNSNSNYTNQSSILLNDTTLKIIGDTNSAATSNSILIAPIESNFGDAGILINYDTGVSGFKGGYLAGDWKLPYKTGGINSKLYFGNDINTSSGSNAAYLCGDNSGTKGYLYGNWAFGYNSTPIGSVVTDTVVGSTTPLRGRTYITGCSTELLQNEGKTGVLVMQSVDSNDTNTKEAWLYLRPTTEHSNLGIVMHYKKADNLYSGILYGSWQIDKINKIIGPNSATGSTAESFYIQASSKTYDNFIDNNKSIIYIRPTASEVGTTSGKTCGITMECNSSGSSGKLIGTWSLNGAAISTTSDKNKKNTILMLSNEYSILFDNLIPVTYKYNDGTSNRFHTGFIAQEVEEAIQISGLTTQDFAGLVIANEENEDGLVEQSYYLRYEEFIALNTSEIQKLKHRVSELETELNSLKLMLNS